MDPNTAVDPNNILSAKGLVVAITGGGSGTQDTIHPLTHPMPPSSASSSRSTH